MEPSEVIQILEKNGCRGVFIPLRRAEEVREEIRGLHKDGKLDEAFYKEWMPPYVEKYPRHDRSAKSILLVATPAMQRKVRFHHGGKYHDFVVPPTYTPRYKLIRRLKHILNDGRKNNQIKLTATFPPLKLLAVRSGLAAYGRNNISYVHGLGSFHRLTAFYTDIEATDGKWGEKRLLPKCAKCRVCLSACPTRAISEDRILLRAERCLSHLNEMASEHEFPSWVEPEWHNAIVGCMRCQSVCPYDSKFLDRFDEVISFSDEETTYLLKGKYSGKKAAAVRKKLRAAGLDLSTFPRNLKVLLDRPSSGRSDRRCGR